MMRSVLIVLGTTPVASSRNCLSFDVICYNMHISGMVWYRNIMI